MRIAWASLRNYVALQLLWLAAVAGAGRGWWWSGPAALAVLAMLHFGLHWHVRGDAGLMLAAVLLGALVDSIMAMSGLIHYAAAWPSASLAPIWILALWTGLGMTLNNSFGWPMRHPAWMLPLMALGGPLSYWGAQASFGALRFTAPATPGLLLLGALWAAATAVLLALVARADRRQRAAPASKAQA